MWSRQCSPIIGLPGCSGCWVPSGVVVSGLTTRWPKSWAAYMQDRDYGFHWHLPPATIAPFGMVGRRKGGRVLRPVLGNFQVKYSARKLAPPFKHKVHLPWPSKPGRWLLGPWAVGLTSEFPSPRWVATLAYEPLLPVGLLSEYPSRGWAAFHDWRTPPARSIPGYTAPSTRSRPLLLVGHQGSPHRGWSITRGSTRLSGCFRSCYGAHP